MKILIGGSPCTHWSIAQKNNRETEAGGLGWELFKNYLIAKDKFKPDYFLYENNKSAAKPIKEQIAKELGVELQYINSALVSAQNRQRFYAHNVLGVEQPENRSILLRDILESGESIKVKNQVKQIKLNTSGKNSCLLARDYKGFGNQEMCGVIESVEIDPKGAALRTRPNYKLENVKRYKRPEIRKDDKANAITTVQSDSMVCEPVRLGDIGSNSQAHRVYSENGKSVCINAGGGGQGGKTGLYMITESIKAFAPADKGSGNSDMEFLGGIVSGREKWLDDGKNLSRNFSQGNRVYGVNGKTSTINGSGGGLGGHTGLYMVSTGSKEEGYSSKYIHIVKDGIIKLNGVEYPIKLPDGYYIIRKLTPIECERLQTMPDNYTAGVSNTQRYKALGNGWTAEVIIHILKHIPYNGEPVEVLSMYDGIATGYYCMNVLGWNVVKYKAYEIDKYPMQVAMNNYPDIIQCGDAFQVRNNDWEY